MTVLKAVNLTFFLDMYLFYHSFKNWGQIIVSANISGYCNLTPVPEISYGQRSGKQSQRAFAGPAADAAAGDERAAACDATQQVMTRVLTMNLPGVHLD